MRSYKTPKIKHDLTEFSIDHDINLIHTINAYRRINNIYEERKIVVTCDNLFAAWFAIELEEKFATYSTNILTLEKVNLIFWVESDKCKSDDFLANTWLYVTESINYFKNSKVNILFRAVQEEVIKKTKVSSNWRSLYVLVKNNLGEGINTENAREDDFFNALTYIRDASINEVDILKATAKAQGKTMEELEHQLSEREKKIRNLELQLLAEKQKSIEKRIEIVEVKDDANIGKEYRKSPFLFIIKRILKFFKQLFELFKV